MKSLMRVVAGVASLSLAVACGSEKTTPADAPPREDLEATSDAVELALEPAVESERKAAAVGATESRLGAAVETLEQLALISLLELHHAGAVARYYEAAEILPPDADLSRDDVLIELGAMQLRAEQSEAAHDPFEEALRLRKRRLCNLHREVAAGFVQLGDAYQASGVLDRAETLYQRAFDIRGSARTVDSENAAEAKKKLIGVCRLQGKDADADTLADVSGNV